MGENRSAPSPRIVPVVESGDEGAGVPRNSSAGLRGRGALLDASGISFSNKNWEVPTMRLALMVLIIGSAVLLPDCSLEAQGSAPRISTSLDSVRVSGFTSPAKPEVQYPVVVDIRLENTDQNAT